MRRTTLIWYTLAHCTCSANLCPLKSVDILQAERLCTMRCGDAMTACPALCTAITGFSEKTLCVFRMPNAISGVTVSVDLETSHHYKLGLAEQMLLQRHKRCFRAQYKQQALPRWACSIPPPPPPPLKCNEMSQQVALVMLTLCCICSAACDGPCFFES